MKVSHAFVALLSAAAIGAPASGAIIAGWTFEGLEFPTTPGQVPPAPTTGSLAADIGTGLAAAFHASASTVWSTPAGNGSIDSFSSNNWSQNDYYEFRLSTTGSTSLFLGWDQTRSGTGPSEFRIDYSTDAGTTYTPLAGSDYSVLVNAAPNPTWNTTTRHPIYGRIVDLSSVGVNVADFRLRFVQTGTGIAGGGTNRIDNVIFAETEGDIPEPTTLSLLGLSAAGLLVRRRK